jgi:hypothetical protein
MAHVPVHVPGRSIIVGQEKPRVQTIAVIYRTAQGAIIRQRFFVPSYYRLGRPCA